MIRSSLLKLFLGAALCVGTSTPALANPCALSLQGCVLPVGDAPAPVQEVAVSEPVVETRGGIGLLPILLGIAAAGLLAYLLLDNDGDEDPVSP